MNRLLILYPLMGFATAILVFISIGAFLLFCGFNGHFMADVLYAIWNTMAVISLYPIGAGICKLLNL